MEPVFVIIGQSTGTVAAMTAENKKNVQDLKYDEIMKKLVAKRQIFEF